MPRNDGVESLSVVRCHVVILINLCPLSDARNDGVESLSVVQCHAMIVLNLCWLSDAT